MTYPKAFIISLVLLTPLILSVVSFAQSKTQEGTPDETIPWFEQVMGNKEWNESLTKGVVAALRDKYKTDPAFRISTFEEAKAAHHDGDGKKAKHLFSQLATVSDHTPSMRWLARMAFQGDGQDVDAKEAFTWMQRAATQGDTTAMVQTAGMFLEGIGTEKSESSARHWFLYAADRGSKDADTILLEMYRDGIGGAVDPQMTIVFGQRLAKDFEPEGLYFMGVAYRDGTGVQQDLEEAKRLLEFADEYGHSDAKTALEKLITMKETR